MVITQQQPTAIDPLPNAGCCESSSHEGSRRQRQAKLEKTSWPAPGLRRHGGPPWLRPERP